MSRIAVILLAAGQSRRFSVGGSHKLLAHVGTSAVVRHSAQSAIDSGVGEVLVVTGACAAEVTIALRGLNVRIAHEPSFADGMAASLARGVQTLQGSVDAVLVSLGDQPGMRPDAYRRVAARWRETAATIVIPRYAGSEAPAHPVLFGAAVFDELCALSGDVGARSVIARDVSRVAEAAFDWPAPRDVDTPEDLALVHAELTDASAEQSREVHPPPDHA